MKSELCCSDENNDFKAAFKTTKALESYKNAIPLLHSNGKGDTH